MGRDQTRQAAKGEEAEAKTHPLIATLKRIEKSVVRAKQNQEFALLTGDDRQLASELLNSISEQVNETIQQMNTDQE